MTNLAQKDLGLNLSLCSEKLATNCLTYDIIHAAEMVK
jgi:hypothetical protein